MKERGWLESRWSVRVLVRGGRGIQICEWLWSQALCRSHGGQLQSGVTELNSAMGLTKMPVTVNEIVRFAVYSVYPWP